MVLDELAEQSNRLVPLLQFLVALGDTQFDTPPLLELRTDGRRLAVELQRLLEVGVLLLLGRVEIRVGEFQVDVGHLLLAVDREQVLGLGPIDQLGRPEIALASQRGPLGEPAATCPGTLGETLLHGVEGRDRLVVFLIEVQCPSLQVGQIVVRDAFGIGLDRVDRRDGGWKIAVLHQLPNVLGHARRGRVGDIRQGNGNKKQNGYSQAGRSCSIHDMHPIW